MSGWRGAGPAPPWTGEPGRPRASLMMSSPGLTETHRMIILQIEQKPPSPSLLDYPPPTSSIHHPPACSLSPPSYCFALSSTSAHLLNPPSVHLSSDYLTFTQLRPVWSSDTWGGAGIGWIRRLSLPTVAFNQWKSYFGDEQRGSCCFS